MATVGKLASCTLPSIVTRASDVPGAWVAECVPLGVVTQGDSLQQAIEMLVEAVDLVVDDDLERGVDPLRTRQAIPDSVGELVALMSHPLQPIDIVKADDSVTTVLVMVEVIRPHVPAMGTARTEQLASRYTPIGSPLTTAA